MNTNRYRHSLLVHDVDGDWIAPLSPLLDVRERRTDTLHTIVNDDRLDLLAYQYLRDPNLWWIIAEYNHIMWFQSLPIGRVLRIPSFETFYLELMRG